MDAAAQLLRQFEPLVATEVRRIRWRLSSSYLDDDDLFAVGHSAVLEAAQAFQPGRGPLGPWVRRRVRSRLSNALKRAQRHEAPSEDGQVVPNGRSPEELLVSLQAVAWVRGAMGVLPPRQRVIVVARMSGETVRKTAASLGISPTRVQQEHNAALRQLRQQALADGYEGE